MGTQEKSGHKKRPKAPKSYVHLFNACCSCYLESMVTIESRSIPASNPDVGAKRPMSSFYLADYLADFEAAVRKALDTPQQEDCFDVLLRELAWGITAESCDPEVSLGLRAEVVRKCGIELERRRLAPWLYWTRLRK